MTRRLSQLSIRAPRRVLLAWLVVFLGGIVAAPALFAGLETDMGGSDSVESERAYAELGRLRRLSPAPTGSEGGPELYAVVDGVPVDDDATRAEVEGATADVRAVRGVRDVWDVYSTGDARLRADDGLASAIVVVFEPAPDEELDRAMSLVADRLGEIRAPTLLVGNEDIVDDEIGAQAEEDLIRGEVIALPIAFLMMVVLFGGLLAAGLPLLMSIVSVVATLTVLLATTALGDVVVYSINVATMFGIGVGIDYGLLMISRFREERARGLVVADAVARTCATAGLTVVYSGLTVAVALCGLLVFDVDGLRSIAMGGIAVVLISVVAAVSLLPALLTMCGARIRPGRHVAAAAGGVFWRVARVVQRHAGVTVVLVVGALAVAATPFASARFENPDARSLPSSSVARQLDEIRRTRFPSVGGDPIEIVAGVPLDDPRLEEYVAALRVMADVVSVDASAVAPGVDGVVIEVVAAGSDQGDAAQSVVHRLRADRPEFPMLVTGEAAELIDFKQSVVARLPLAAALIGVATLLLIFMMTGSVVIAVKAVMMNVLSLGATFGALVWIFQDGHLSGLLGFDPVGALDATMPLVIFIFAFGLSMDYEVFLISRIKEAWHATGDNDEAVARGLQRSGRIITSAALLIVVVFAGFASGELLLVKQLGVGLAVAVIVDATIVRMLLVPATMTLVGRWNWWSPPPLRRLHARFGLHEPALQ